MHLCGDSKRSARLAFQAENRHGINDRLPSESREHITKFRAEGRVALGYADRRRDGEEDEPTIRPTSS
ncbi:hypothetical protein LMH87_003451 [Akanthomyces muscarius]|uniref:Uncharacterized protein n=1 Tax=Akanthomyces muscarius TaxID=2231603 RepID=A0A9W8UGX1_AKAMU|nr:hypothetical protein LMH87_003451 [Akanthomyces muscarius]KAJ4144570.1 hypothetical protein LMH87_003451 [Akanthomyces muscarius]